MEQLLCADSDPTLVSFFCGFQPYKPFISSYTTSLWLNLLAFCHTNKHLEGEILIVDLAYN